MRKALTLAMAALLAAGIAAPSSAAPRKRSVRPAKTTAKKPAAPAAKPAAVKPPPLIKPSRPAPAWSVAYAPDGKTIAVGGYRKVTLYDAANGGITAEWPVQSDAVRSIRYSKDGKLLAVGTGVPAKSGGVILFDTATGKPTRVLSGYFDAVESVDFAGNLVVSAAADEKIRVADASNGAPLATLGEHVGRCLAVAVPTVTSEQEGGDIFITGGADNAVKVWDAKTRRVVVNFDQCQSPVWSLAFLPRPGQFAAASEDGRVRIFGVRADPDGKPGDGSRTGYLARTLEGHRGSVYAVATSADGKWLVSGGADKKVIFWNDLNKAREVTEAGGDIFGVAVSPDSKTVAAASFDGKARVYNLADGKLLLELPGGPPPAPAAQGEPAKEPAKK